MFVGAKPAEGVYVTIAQIGTAYWFAYFLILAPLVGLLERPSRMPRDIHEYEEMKRSGEIRFFPRLFGSRPTPRRKDGDAVTQASPAE